MDYPYAYLNGKRCCRSNQELKKGGLQKEIKSGTCDGMNFNRESTCCKDNDHQTCPHIEGCFDYSEAHNESNYLTGSASKFQIDGAVNFFSLF